MSRRLAGMLPARRSLVARLDLARSTGLRHAWRRWRRDRVFAKLIPERRERVAAALWAEAASELGAAVRKLAHGQLELRRGSAVTIVRRQLVPLNSPLALELAADKPAAYRLLAEAGLPVPEHLAFEAGETGKARAFLADGPLPCVVKPARGSGGDGVTGEISRPRELRRAVLAASRFSPRLLIEHQLAGEVFRFLVLDGRVLDVVRRSPPAISGDGHSSVEELIFAEYERRIRDDSGPGLKPFVVDLDTIFSLRRAGIRLRAVPPAGAIVRLKTVTNYNRAEENQTVRTAVSTELEAEIASAVAVLGLRLAGVDVVATTVAASLAASGGAIIDVNGHPALHHHAQVADAQGATRVAVPVLRALLEAPRQARAASPVES
ncbi:MAG TPA: hypothetical protein VF002_04840 [Gaiellaceae bacterium]